MRPKLNKTPWVVQRLVFRYGVRMLGLAGAKAPRPPLISRSYIPSGLERSKYGNKTKDGWEGWGLGVGGWGLGVAGLPLQGMLRYAGKTQLDTLLLCRWYENPIQIPYPCLGSCSGFILYVQSDLVYPNSLVPRKCRGGSRNSLTGGFWARILRRGGGGGG